MTARPDAEMLLIFLVRCRRRLSLVAALDGAAIGFGLATIVIVMAWLVGWTTTTAAVLATTGVVAACAYVVWRTVGPAPAAAHAGLVYRYADRVVERLDARELFPVGRATATLAAAIVVSATAAVALAGRT